MSSTSRSPWKKPGRKTSKTSAFASGFSPEEVLDFEVECLQLKVENAKAEAPDLSVDYDDAFDLKELALRAGEEAGVPPELWEKVMGKL